MKTFKTISLAILNIIIFLLCIAGTASLIWYILPEIQGTDAGLWLLKFISLRAILWSSIGVGISLIIFIILELIFSKNMSSKFKNIFIHLDTWAIFLISIILVVMTFIMVEKLENEVIIATLRKIYIIIDLIALFVFYAFSNKLSKVINRRIQAYETAKEMNSIGRGSIVWTNFLKLFEIFFPEVLILLLVCFFAGWNVATYFIIVLVASALPMIGNIICDINIRKEILKKQKAEKAELVNQIANKIKEK